MKRTRRTSQTIVNVEAGADATEIEREETMALEEEVVVAEEAEAAVEEAEEATATTTMQEEGVATSMEAEAAKGTTMGTRTTSVSGINNTRSRTSISHRCLQPYPCHTQYQALRQHTRATIWTFTPTKWVAMPTVASGATKGSSNGCDRPHLVQRASLQ